MPLTPGESDRLLLHLEATLAQRRRDRGLLLNVPEARALIADAVCEWARDGLSWVDVRERAEHLLSADDVLPGVAEALGEIRVEARFDDGTRLVVVKDPCGPVTSMSAEDVENWAPVNVGMIEIGNEATTAIGLTSHIHLAEVNPRLRLDRSAAFGMRLAIPTGETVWLNAGQVVQLPIAAIAGERVVVGNTGVIDGRLDDPAVRARALATLRDCGYLDVVDGENFGNAAAAEAAIAALMANRSAAGGESS
jgi:urease subunit gamma/beta